jgi:hypothetical protein
VAGDSSFQLCDIRGHLLVRNHHLSKTHEGPDNVHAHLDGPALLSTFAAMIAPCSVKTFGSFRRPPRPFDVAFCDIKAVNSCRDRGNMKSGGNRFWFRS